MNLGTALRMLGERESGTAQLEAAVAAYHAVLEEWTRERVLLDWAATQMNLGTALVRLGERDGGTAGRRGWRRARRSVQSQRREVRCGDRR
jgi:hypothetical protein